MILLGQILVLFPIFFVNSVLLIEIFTSYDEDLVLISGQLVVYVLIIDYIVSCHPQHNICFGYVHRMVMVPEIPWRLEVVVAVHFVVKAAR